MASNFHAFLILTLYTDDITSDTVPSFFMAAVAAAISDRVERNKNKTVDNVFLCFVGLQRHCVAV